ncbi:MAG TPA: hypothetical protein VMV69_25035 [Pirellulales bacterium]|nr:hypothetical protein [Pirellulales bacterium]
MSLLLDVNRAGDHATPSLPECNLRVEEDNGLFTIQGGRRSTPLQWAGQLSAYEVRRLYEALRKHFGETCTECERRAAFNAREGAVLKDHAGLLAIAQLEYARAVKELGSVAQVARVVAELADLSDEEDVQEYASEQGFSVWL